MPEPGTPRAGDSFHEGEWNPHENQELVRDAQLAEIVRYARGLTRERNNEQFPTPLDRTSHLVDGGGEILDALRVENREILPVLGAKILMRIFNVLEGLGETTDGLIDAVIEKYYRYSDETPEGGCVYCGGKPCVCGTDKPKATAERKPVPSELRKELSTWSLTTWQEYFDSLYGPNNRERGWVFTGNRAVAEMIEANTWAMRMKNASSPEAVAECKAQLMFELADSFAWLAGIYNVLGPSVAEAPKLDEQFVERYGKGCPNCGNYPCRCAKFSYLADRKNKLLQK